MNGFSPHSDPSLGQTRDRAAGPSHNLRDWWAAFLTVGLPVAGILALLALAVHLMDGRR